MGSPPLADAARDSGAAYREHMAYVLYRLRCEFPRLSGDERLEVYNEVWTRLLERSRSGFCRTTSEPG